MLEDVTLFRDRQIHVHVRFKGGKTQSLRLSLSPNASQRYKTKPQVVEQIDHLLNEFTYSQIADKLNARGWQSGPPTNLSPGPLSSICAASMG